MPKTDAVIYNPDGNGFVIIGAAITAMRKENVDKDVIEKYKKEAMAGDYDNLLMVTMKYVEIVIGE